MAGIPKQLLIGQFRIRRVAADPFLLCVAPSAKPVLTSQSSHGLIPRSVGMTKLSHDGMPTYKAGCRQLQRHLDPADSMFFGCLKMCREKVMALDLKTT